MDPENTDPLDIAFKRIKAAFFTCKTVVPFWLASLNNVTNISRHLHPTSRVFNYAGICCPLARATISLETVII
jgi:hypothetical protein